MIRLLMIKNKRGSPTMTKQIDLNKLTLGTDQPERIIVPIVADNVEEILLQADTIMTSPADIVEWRLDYLPVETVTEKLVEIGKRLKEILGELPLIVTNRTSDEGGMQEFNEQRYVEWYDTLVSAQIADAIDVEFSKSDQVITHLKHLTNNSDTKLILSHHDFEKTDEKNVLVFLFAQMAKQEPDIIKVATTPANREDVMNLMDATIAADNQIKQPIISMAMGRLGKISRIAGETFGSVATFAAVKKVSAPGQFNATDLRRTLDIIE